MFNSLTGYDYDYTDSFEAELTPGDDRSPEQLARAVFEGAPRPVRWFLVAGFRFGLGLRLSPRASPDHVLGWAIIARDPDSITVQAQSWLLTSRLIFRAHESRVAQATFVRYERPFAPIVWLPVSVLHRQIVPRLVRHAAATP